ncbi:MAG: hypothetical protein LBU44_06405 [Mediterranea sp.]|jgi:hypothetical protein|nr:hypothetical protein [Mediterranea sp.]
MKKFSNCLTIMLLMALVLISSCGGSGGTGSKSVDIPGYATLAESYFANRETKTSHAWYGKADSNLGSKKFGSYHSGMLTGILVEMEGESFVMLQDGGNLSLTKYLFEQDYDYSVQLLWHEHTEDNPINSTLAANDLRGRGFVPLENNYCDSYYFFRDEQFEEAKRWLEALEKQPNQNSQYDAKAEGGVKTYKAKIGKVVEYFGVDDLKSDCFLSLYLDCGAVVELRPKGLFLTAKETESRIIDCVTDTANKVIVYELN